MGWEFYQDGIREIAVFLYILRDSHLEETGFKGGNLAASSIAGIMQRLARVSYCRSIDSNSS